jgi:hypothetical protein
MEAVLHNAPLPFKEIWNDSEKRKRVLFFNPSPVYERIKVDPYKRIQSISVGEMFPSIPGECSCGCGAKLEGRRTRWAGEDCSYFAFAVRGIICGHQQVISGYICSYSDYKCMRCEHKEVLFVDHVIPVKHGGGGCWLSNYQYLCHECHVEKTKEDFGWGQHKTKHQLKLFA